MAAPPLLMQLERITALNPLGRRLVPERACSSLSAKVRRRSRAVSWLRSRDAVTPVTARGDAPRWRVPGAPSPGPGSPSAGSAQAHSGKGGPGTAPRGQAAAGSQGAAERVETEAAPGNDLLRQPPDPPPAPPSPPLWAAAALPAFCAFGAARSPLGLDAPPPGLGPSLEPAALGASASAISSLTFATLPGAALGAHSQMEKLSLGRGDKEAQRRPGSLQTAPHPPFHRRPQGEILSSMRCQTCRLQTPADTGAGS